MSSSRAVTIVIAGLTALLANAALAQNAPPYNTVTLDLRPADGAPGGEIELYCGDFGEASVRLGGDSTRGPLVTYLIWIVDGERADTTFMIGGALSRDDSRRFAAGLRGARSLEVWHLGSDPGGPRTKYSYDISRLGRRVQNAACVRTATEPIARRRWPPPEGLVANPAPDSVRRTPTSPPDSAIDRKYELSAVEEQPELVNSQEVRRAIERNYPPLLRDAGVGGSVEVRFRILEDGRIDPGSILIERSSHQGFEEPVRRLLPILHFRPARVNGRPVKVWVTLPVHFSTSS